MKKHLTQSLLALFLGLAVSNAPAASGTWTNPSGGSWTNSANWSGGTIADGADATADFGTLDISARTTVTLDGDRTIGNLTFDDTGATGDTNWVLSAGSGGVLTLETTSGKPAITVNMPMSGNGATTNSRITLSLAGTNGFTKAGPGMLWLDNPSHSLSGTIDVSAGYLSLLTGAASLPNITNINVGASAQFSIGAYPGTPAAGTPLTFDRPVTLSGIGPDPGAFLVRAATGIISGPITYTAASRVGLYGTDVMMRIEGGITGTAGDLRLQGNGGAAGHKSRFEIASPLRPAANTILVAASSDATFVCMAPNVLPTNSTQQLSLAPATSGNNNRMVLALNGYDQRTCGLTSPAWAANNLEKRVVNRSTNFCTLTMDWSGTATLGFTAVLGNPGNADDNNFRMVKEGTGTWQSNTTNYFTGGLHVKAGRTIWPAGVNFTGGILIDPGAFCRQQGGGNLGTQAITNNGVMEYSATVPITVNTPISGSGGVSIIGAGPVTFNVPMTYTGPTTNYNAGLTGSKLIQSTSKALGGGDLIARTLATNVLNVDVVNGTVTNANMRLDGNVGFGPYLEVNLGSASNPTQPIYRVPGTLTALGSGSIQVTVNGTGLTVGQFPLIAYGALAGDGFAAFNPTVTVLGATATLTNTGTSLDVVISGVNAEEWTGVVNGDWDLFTVNWTNRQGGFATTYTGTLPVLFDDNAPGTSAVNLTTVVTPPLMIVSNVAKTYSFTSTGGLLSGAAQLVKKGSGTMTMNAPNDYSGATFIQEGTLKLGTAEVIPNGTGKSDPIVNGVLDLAGFNETVNEFSGTGVITNSTGTLSTFTFGATTTTGGFDGGFAGAVQVVRTNTGTFTLRGSNTHTSGTIVQRGRLDLANTNGQCLASDLTLESAAGNPSGSTVRLGSAEQIADTAKVIYAGDNNKDLRFSMMGHNETIAGLVSAVTATNNVIFEAASDQLSNAPAVLTIVSPAGETNELLKGNIYLRDTAFGTLGWATNNPGFINPSPLTVIKTGPGTQVAGVQGPYRGNVNFSGGLKVEQGTFVLVNTVVANSRITNNAALVFDLNTFPPTNGTYGLSYATNYWQSNSISGSGTLTKLGDGTLVLDGPVSQGALNIEAGGLSGVGSISAPVTLAAGTRLAPGSTTNNSYLPFPLGLAPADPGIGLLTINNTLTLDAASTTVMELDKANGTNDAVAGITTLNYGGTLTVTNLGGTFVGGESYQLFSAATYVGNFSATNLPPLDPGLNWVWNPGAGILSVSGGVPSTPTNLTFAVTGGGTTLELSWPDDYLSWYVQSNGVSVADTNAWFDVPGSESVTTLSIPIAKNIPQVYYRMRKP